MPLVALVLQVGSPVLAELSRHLERRAAVLEEVEVGRQVAPLRGAGGLATCGRIVLGWLGSRAILDLGALLLSGLVLGLWSAGLLALLIEGRRVDLATVWLLPLLRLALLLLLLFLTTLARFARASIAAAALALEGCQLVDQVIDALRDFRAAFDRLVEQLLGLAALVFCVAGFEQ